MTGRLDGHACLVTGSSGIARATALRLVSEGASVWVVGIDTEGVRRLVDELRAGGSAAGGTAADLRDGHATEVAVDECVTAFGRLDGVVAVAGGSGRRHGDGPIHEMTDAAWHETFSMNATPVMTTCRAAVRAMRPGGGSLVVVSSVLATSPSPARFETHAYAATKGAAVSLVRSMAASYAPDGVRVNAVLPGVTDTPMATRAASDPDIEEYLLGKQPLTGGMVDPDDVAATIAFLVSSDARAITGQAIAVDGGWMVS